MTIGTKQQIKNRWSYLGKHDPDQFKHWHLGACREYPHWLRRRGGKHTGSGTRSDSVHHELRGRRQLPM